MGVKSNIYNFKFIFNKSAFNDRPTLILECFHGSQINIKGQRQNNNENEES